MNILKSLVLFIALFNIAFALLPAYPGPIQKSQLTDVPSAVYYKDYYGFENQIGVFPLSSGCNTLSKITIGTYTPIVVLNETAVLAYELANDDQLSIAIITPQGITEIQVQPNLQNAITLGLKSNIYYDDKTKSYFFLNGQNQVVIFSIDTNMWSSSGVSGLNSTSNYYDLTTSTLVSSGPYTNNGTVYTGIFMVTTSASSFFIVQDFNLAVGIENVQISSFGSNFILLGSNGTTHQSYLYALDFYYKSSELIGTFPYGTSLITGVNPQYVVLVSSDKTSMSLFDLTTYTAQNFTNNCVPNSISSFLSSILIKDIFSN